MSHAPPPGTAREILEQCDGRLDAFVDFVGTAGTFAGCAKYFKERLNVRIKCLVVEPAGTEVGSSDDGMHVNCIESWWLWSRYSGWRLKQNFLRSQTFT